jgi:hypothetical protein
MSGHTPTCILCQRPFRHGPHVYNGRYIRQWDDYLCQSCDGGNHDGIVGGSWPGFIERLKTRGVEPVINDRGWIVIPPRG